MQLCICDLAQAYFEKHVWQRRYRVMMHRWACWMRQLERSSSPEGEGLQHQHSAEWLSILSSRAIIHLDITIFNTLRETRRSWWRPPWFLARWFPWFMDLFWYVSGLPFNFDTLICCAILWNPVCSFSLLLNTSMLGVRRQGGNVITAGAMTDAKEDDDRRVENGQ